MDVQLVVHLNYVVEKMVDKILHVPMDLEYHKEVLVVFVFVVVVEYDNMEHLVVDQTSFDYLEKRSY
jgi:Na+-translocating ferredoxin:NAD+ oxidoreductase RnfA subunit